MQVRWHRSLTFKLFLLMTISLAACVIAVSAHYISQFNDHMRRGLEDGTLQRAREVATSVAATLDYWNGLAAMPVHYLARLHDVEAEGFVKSFVSSNRDIVAFSLTREETPGASIFVFTDDSDHIRFQDKNPEAVATAVRQFHAKWLSDLARDIPRNGRHIFDLEALTSLPIMAIATRFTDQSNEGALWTMAILWKSKILNALPSKDDFVGAVVDTSGSPLVEVRKGHLKLIDRDAWASLLRTSDSRSGARAYASDDGPALASIARLDGYPLAVGLKLDTKRGEKFVAQSLKKTVVWSWIFLLFFVLLSSMAAGSATKRLASLGKTAQKIAAGEFESAVPLRGGDEISALGASVVSMADQLQDLVKNRVASARLEKEVETARLVQESFLPRQSAKTPFLEVSGTCLAASECGGDWWHYFNDGSPFHVLVIADATGHGVGAALVTAMAYSAFRTMLDRTSSRPDHFNSPAELLSTIHRVLLTTGGGRASMTCFVGILDERTGILRYASAGHCPALLIREGDAPLGLKTIGNPIGMSSTDPDIVDCEVVLEAGDRLILYSDGLTEGRDASGKPWGKSKLKRTAANLIAANAEEALSQVLEIATSHFSRNELEDDVTIVVVEVDRSWTKLMAKAAA